MSQDKKDTKLVGICWADPETFWWNATDDPVCPACPEDDTGYQEQHGFFVERERNERLRDAADWYVRCLEDVQDRRPVRGLAEAKAGYDSAREAVLAEQEKEQPPK